MRRAAAIATLVLIAATTAAGAQDTAPAAAPAADDMRARLVAMDSDHDGRWSKTEWLAGGRKERGFEFMDTNHDGSLTPDELRTGMARLKDMRGAR